MPPFVQKHETSRNFKGAVPPLARPRGQCQSNVTPGRFSGSWVVLLAAPSRTENSSVAHHAAFVTTYSGGSAVDSHHLPSSSHCEDWLIGPGNHRRGTQLGSLACVGCKLHGAVLQVLLGESAGVGLTLGARTCRKRGEVVE